jgi:hypothetical protein
MGLGRLRSQPDAAEITVESVKVLCFAEVNSIRPAHWIAPESVVRQG